MSGKFHKLSKSWATVPIGGPATERWRGFHQNIGTPHPSSWEDRQLVVEVMPSFYDRFRDGMHAIVWSCEDPVRDGPVLYVACPWCSRCKMRSEKG